MFVYNNILFNWTKNDHTYRDFLTNKTKGVEKMVDVFNTSSFDKCIYNLIDFDLHMLNLFFMKV